MRPAVWAAALRRKGGPGAAGLAFLALLLCLCTPFCTPLCTGALAASPARQEILVTGAHIVEHGLYGLRQHPAPGADRANPLDTINGIHDSEGRYELLARAGRVLARRGTAIGLGYVITGRPKGASVPVELVVQHPDIVNQQTGIAGSVSHAEYARVLGQKAMAFWSFDTEDGLVPGVYVLTIRCQGQELARRAFSVRVEAKENR